MMAKEMRPSGLVSLSLFCVLSTLLLSSSAETADVNLHPTGPESEDVAELKPHSNIWKSYSEFKPGDGKNSRGVCTDEYSCMSLSMTEAERSVLEAIQTLHGQLDDDANGNIDLSESDEFLRQELHYEGGHERRQKAFHLDDTHISVRELWHIWIRSEVHNWTTEQTTDWLSQFVQLPQYVSHFQLHRINGTQLPRLAINNVQYLSTVLGIRDPIHRQKIAVKAMDVVLFGPPKHGSSKFKDIILTALVIIAIAGCWYIYQTKRHSKEHLSKLMEHMANLSSAEKELKELQVKYHHARQEQNNTLSEKIRLERQLEQGTDSSATGGANPRVLSQIDMELAEVEMRKLKEQVEVLRGELQRAEGELEDRVCWTPPADLQHWLQLTYELEQRVYNKKRLQAEKQLEQAKDACERLNRKRSSFVASFVSTHGRSIDDVDKSILEARSALIEVKQDLQERTTRWRQIESLCGISIAINPGLNYLETLLRSGTSSSRYVVLNSSSRHGTTFEEDPDETSSVVSSSAAYSPQQQQQQQQKQQPQQPQEGRSSNRSGSAGLLKKILPQRDSSVSLESTSSTISSNGNGSSASVSLSELPRTTSGAVSRPRLNQRESSKDSAFDGSTVSSMGHYADEETAEAKFSIPSRSITLAMKTSGGVATSPAIPSPLHSIKSSSVTSSLASDRVSSSAGLYSETNPRCSPKLLPKWDAKRFSPINKSLSQESQEMGKVLKPVLRKISQSESALDISFQLALQNEESGQEETLSTDSSIPSMDDRSVRKMKKKRFHFPSFVKRKNKASKEDL